jgi:hypothetical protein
VPRIEIPDDFDEPMVLVTEKKLLRLVNEAKAYIDIGWDQSNESADLSAAIVAVEKELNQRKTE